MIHDRYICDGNDGSDGNDGNAIMEMQWWQAMMAMIAMDHLGREMSVLGRSATSAATNQIIDLNNGSSFCFHFCGDFVVYIFKIVVKVIIFF